MRKGVMRPGHVQLRVLDVEEALKHYRDLIGLIEVERDDQGRAYLKGWTEVDKFSVVLVPADEPGMDFMAFKCVDEKTVDKLREELMGFGCNVPAIMSARTIEEPRARLITILINPFMSCSARLPVYVLLAGIFFTDHAGTVLFGLYMLGILVAFAIAALLARTISEQHDETFIMELPPWRFPSSRSMLLHVWDKAGDFLRKIGGVILVGSILIWLLQSFPQQGAPWLEQLGHFVAPLFAPMGFGWQETVALLSGFIAKEVIAASLVVVYQTDMNDMAGLQAALGSALAPASGLALMVFTLLYMPCLATIATIRRETGSWRWAGVSILMGLVLAWLGAWLVYTLASLWI